MKHLRPLFTLLSVAVLAAVLLGINMSKETVPVAQIPAPTTTTTTTATVAPVIEEMYVGRAGGASIAVAVKGDKAIAYICDGRQFESWLEGTVSDGSLSLRDKAGGELTGSIAGEQVSGTVLRMPFAASVVQPPAGLYQANVGVLDRIGWVLRPDGTSVGLRSRDGGVQAAPRFDPLAVTVDGRQVRVEKVTGS